ncbi:alpha/beta hydrolase [Micromonospora sp. CA-259024]|uniref:alpha/beta hydrolase n=1 Tax=Micromonospora sp. CA-259024 TaxID=3239965 RepID=UPI003D8D62AB
MPDSSLAPAEWRQIEAANASERTPVVFVHGVWLLAQSWDRWRGMFDGHGYATLAPGWPGEPETVDVGRDRPELFAGTSVGDIVEHYASVVSHLRRRPLLVGHSLGGLVTQILAGRGLAAASVVIAPTPGRGVLPLPWSAVRATLPVLRRPRSRSCPVMLTYRQFRYAFTNTVGEAEARELYDTYAVPGSGLPVFQAAVANLNPRTVTWADPAHPRRGPMKFLSGQMDNTVPWTLTNAAYRRQRRSAFPTAIEELRGRGHSLIFDHGWQEIAEHALGFLRSA